MWVQRQELVAPDAVAIAGTGSAYVFLGDGATWDLEHTFAAPPGEEGTNFGQGLNSPVTCSSSGHHTDRHSRGRGAAAPATPSRDAGEWKFSQTFLPADIKRGDGFGARLRTDGRTS